MNAATDRYYRIGAWALIAAFTLFRLRFAGLFLLAPDETNYWQWSRYLAWGYHDQAPMIAWTIKLATLLCGHTATAVRLPSILSMAIASAYLTVIAQRWVNARTAFYTALLTQGILAFNVGGLLATADGLQAAAWAAATFHVARAYEDDRWSQWLLAGAWFGVGLLSKYTMVAFLPGAYLYGLLFKRHRPRLATLRPYAGVALGLAMFLPVILWNAGNNWNSLRHVAFIGGANEGFRIQLNTFGDYWASQAALITPLVFVLVLAAWVQALRRGPGIAGRWIHAYLALTSLPMFIGFALLSLHTRVYGNWPGSAYLAAMVLVAAFFGDRPRHVLRHPRPPWGQRLWPWALGTAYLFSALVLTQAVWPLLPLPTDLDRTSTELQGWDRLGAAAGDTRNHMPRPAQTFLFGLRYQTASELAFYAPGQPRTVSINKWKRPNVYDYWWQDADLLGMDGVGAAYEDGLHETLLPQVFERVDPPIRLDIYRDAVWHTPRAGRAPVRSFYLYRAYGFKGGLRWAPRDPRDIRAP